MIAPKSLVLDLNKCQWATLYWKTKDGYIKSINPTAPTVHGCYFDEEAKHFSGPITMLDYATKHNLLDKWFPVCTFQLSANHTVTYTGDKAIKMYDAWKGRVFSKKKGSK